MCEFCQEWNSKGTICGKEIDVHKCANETNLTDVQILKNTEDEKPGIIIYSNHSKALGFFDIDYCPMCGRKLVEE